jgi:hypothetical protein
VLRVHVLLCRRLFDNDNFVNLNLLKGTKKKTDRHKEPQFCLDITFEIPGLKLDYYLLFGLSVQTRISKYSHLQFRASG